jgi:hypothetical protein
MLGIPAEHPSGEPHMAKHRVVLVVEEENGKWKMKHRIANEAACKFPPNSGAGDVNDLDAWLSEEWRPVTGTAAPILQPVLATSDGNVGTIRARLTAQSMRQPDRLVLVLEHD